MLRRSIGEVLFMGLMDIAETGEKFITGNFCYLFDEAFSL